MLTPRAAALPVLLLLAATVGGLLITAAFTPAAAMRGLHADVGIYFDVGQRLARGEVPYRDFASEYPPLAMVPIAVARFVPSAQSVDLGVFAARLLIANTALAAVGFGLVTWLGSRGHHAGRIAGWAGAAAVGATYAALSILLGTLVDWRYDILPAVLSLAALALLVSRRPALSGIALGAAVAAKLYAAPLAPLFIGWHLARREWAEAGRFTAGFAVVGAVVLAPFVLAGVDLSFLRYQLDRGLQIESVPAGIVELAHLLGVDAASSVGFGSVQVDSALNQPVLAVFGALAPIVVGVVIVAGVVRLWQDREHGGPDVHTLAPLVAATLLAVVITNKALSPQYMIWLLPFVPLLSRGPRGMMIAATALTVIIFPFLYADLRALEPIPVAAVNLRNGLLLATLGWLMVEHRPVLRRATTEPRARAAVTHPVPSRAPVELGRR